MGVATSSLMIKDKPTIFALPVDIPINWQSTTKFTAREAGKKTIPVFGGHLHPVPIVHAGRNVACNKKHDVNEITLSREMNELIMTTV